MSRGVEWPDDHIELLKNLCAAGCTMAEALEVFPGRTKNGIYHQCQRFGLSVGGKAPEPDWETAKKYLELRKG